MCVHIVILGPVLGQDVVEQRARAGEDSESNSLLRIHDALIEKVFLLMESHSSYIPGPPTCRPK